MGWESTGLSSCPHTHKSFIVSASVSPVVKWGGRFMKENNSFTMTGMSKVLYFPEISNTGFLLCHIILRRLIASQVQVPWMASKHLSILGLNCRPQHFPSVFFSGPWSFLTRCPFPAGGLCLPALLPPAARRAHCRKPRLLHNPHPAFPLLCSFF